MTPDGRALSTYHVLHVGGRRVHLTPQLVVQVEDEVHVPLTDGPPPPGPALPPLLALVQDGLELCGIVQDHRHDSLGQAQKQACQMNPGRCWRAAPHGHLRLLLMTLCKRDNMRH